MSFRTGTVAYARFLVRGGPGRVSDEVVEALAANAHRAADEDSPAGPPGPSADVRAGWVGAHLFDSTFERESIAFGETLLFGLRIDRSMLPTEVRAAYRALAERAHVTGRGASDFSPARGRGARREAREEADERCRAALASGRYQRSKLVGICWDLEARVLFAPAFGDATVSALRDTFEAAFDAQLEPASSGALARERLGARGRTRDYEDLAPSPFTPPPAGAQSEAGRSIERPLVPWCDIGPEPKDFLGNEFLVWLWAHAETEDAVIATEHGPVAFAIDRSLDMECAWEVSGTQALRASGPARLPEALVALRRGKWPRKVGLVFAANGDEWTCTLHADRFQISGVRLPKPADAPASEREAIEWRLASLRSFDRALVGVFNAFLDARTSDGWPAQRKRLAAWIAGLGGSRRAPVTEPVSIT